MPSSSPVVRLSEEFMRLVEAGDLRAINRLIVNYSRSVKRLEGLLEALLLEVGGRKLTAGQITRMKRYVALMEQVGVELAGLQGLAGNEVEAGVRANIGLGGRQARELLAMTVVGPGDELGRVAAAFNGLPVGAIEAMVGFLEPGGALYERLRLLGPSTAEWVSQAIQEGVTLGFNPVKIARMVQAAFGRGLTEAMRLVRTAQLWAYREANRATYLANSDVVEGWIWHADLGPRTCGSCFAMHGSFHLLSEALNDHHNGRCRPLPVVRGYERPVEESGEVWFGRQSEGFQRGVLGKGKWEAWKGGRFEFGDLTAVYEDEVYGGMRREARLEELVGL